MLLTNLTSSEYYVGNKNYLLSAGGTLTIPDEVYNADNAIAAAANSLVASNKASGSSTPVGFPRSTSSSGVTTAELNAAVAAGTGTKRLSIKVTADDAVLATGDGQFIFSIPSDLNGKNLTGISAYVTTASTSGLPTIQLRNVTDSVDFLSTKVSIDANEFDSSTAATPAVIDLAHDDVATGDRIAVDVDVAGTGAKGLGLDLVFA